MSLFQQEVEEQLLTIHKNRNRYVWVSNIVLAALSTYFHREELLRSHFWWLSLLTIFTGVTLRYVHFHKFYESWKKEGKKAILLNYLSLTVLTAGWVLHFYDVYTHYGPSSASTSNTLIFVAGLVAAASVALVAHKKSFYFYSSVMCGGPILIYFLDQRSQDGYVACYVLVFYVFTFFQVRSGHKQLRRSVENERRAFHEKNHFRKLFNTVPGYFAILDKDLTYVDANEATLKFIPGLLGKQLGHRSQGSEFEAFVRSFAHSDKTYDVRELSVFINGKTHWFLQSVQRMENDTIVMVGIPMDELVKMKEELKIQEAKAYYSAKLASLGEMAAGIAHEVNNPLTIIQGVAGIIQKLVSEGPVDKKELQELSGKLVETSERISRTIRSLKALSRNGENDPFEEVDLEKMITQCLNICGNRFMNERVELRLPRFEKAVHFQGREVQLSQVLMNLLSNAIDAARCSPGPWVEIKYNLTNKSLELMVIDSGPGVHSDIRNRIMEPFFTTKDINQGTGLGLSISKSIITDHGGELSLLENEKHTTFKIHLPFDKTLS